MTHDRTPRRVLAVRVGRMGDLVMLTPALRLLLDGLPGAEVHLLTTAEGRRVLRGFDPRLTTFHLYHRRFPRGLIERGALRRTLRAIGFDRVYRFESNPFYRKLTHGLAPEEHGFDPASRTRHYSARCLEVVAPTVVRPAVAGPLTLPVSAEGRAAAAAYLEKHGIGSREVPVGLHLTFSESGRGLLASGRGRRHREWPAESCAALAQRLVEVGHRT